MAFCRQQSRPASPAHLCPLQSRTASLCVNCRCAVVVVSRQLALPNVKPLPISTAGMRPRNVNKSGLRSCNLRPPQPYPPGKSGVLIPSLACGISRLTIDSSILTYTLHDRGATNSIANTKHSPAPTQQVRRAPQTCALPCMCRHQIRVPAKVLKSSAYCRLQDEDLRRLLPASGSPRCQPCGCSRCACPCACGSCASSQAGWSAAKLSHTLPGSANLLLPADCSSLAATLAGDCSDFTGAVQDNSNLQGADNSTLSGAIGSRKPSNAYAIPACSSCTRTTQLTLKSGKEEGSAPQH